MTECHRDEPHALASSKTLLKHREKLLSAAVLVWVVPASLFFHIRFSAVFFAAYEEAITALWSRISGG